MRSGTSSEQRSDVVDVRQVPKPERHPTIFSAYEALGVGESFVLINDHDPRHLREEFDRDFPGSYAWTYVNRDPGDWRIRITKLAGAALPRVLVNTDELPDGDAAGAIWKIAVAHRDLDTNVVWLPSGESIAPHAGPNLDVLVHVLAGEGHLVTERGDVPLRAGALAYLPRRSVRGFVAGASGLRYLTVHRKRASLVIEPAPPTG